jgi:hypothetical protein
MNQTEVEQDLSADAQVHTALIAFTSDQDSICSTLLPYIDALVTANPGEAHLLKSRVQLLIPHSGCLLQAIERLSKPNNIAKLALLKTIRLLYVEFLHKIAVKKSIRDVNRVSLPIFKGTDS